MALDATGQAAKKTAAEMARAIGDEAWKQGKTKHALEAYEASDITLEELLEMAQKLSKAEELIKECFETLPPQVPYHGHNERGATIFRPELAEQCFGDNPKCEYHPRLVKKAASVDNCLRRIFSLLKWEPGKSRDGHPARGENSNFVNADFYRAARVACLKLIKRM